MTEPIFENEVEAALKVLQDGGVILYPTDTVWGLGCDAANEAAVQKIYRIKQRAESKSLIMLVAEERDILQYVAAPDPEVFAFLEEQTRPTTVIFNQGIGLPDSVLAEDGSLALRLVQDPFCRHLVKRLRRPLVSTSANISGEPTPRIYAEVSEAIRSAVDHIVQWRQQDATTAPPSKIIKWRSGGDYQVIRP